MTSSYVMQPAFSRLPFLLIAGLLLFLSACRMETVSLPWKEVPSPTTRLLTSVRFADPLHGHAVGGATWSYGVDVHTEDGGLTWLADSLTNKQLLNVQFNPQGDGFAVGFDGLLLYKNAASPLWEEKYRYLWSVLRGAAFNAEGGGVLVGGAAFQHGAAIRLDNQFQVLSLDTFAQELRSVCYSDGHTVHAVGYGIILRSVDGGTSWQPSSSSGDFYQSVCFPSAQTGYIAGYQGTILKTNDGGLSWERLRNGDSLLEKDLPFRCIYFVDDQKGYIVGDGGLFWRTENGGQDWKQVSGFPDTDLYGVFATAGKGFIVGDRGKIYQFSD